MQVTTVAKYGEASIRSFLCIVPYTHIHTNTHTQAHKYTCAQMYTYTHSIRTYAHINSHTYKHKHTYKHMYTHLRPLKFVFNRLQRNEIERRQYQCCQYRTGHTCKNNVLPSSKGMVVNITKDAVTWLYSGQVFNNPLWHSALNVLLSLSSMYQLRLDMLIPHTLKSCLTSRACFCYRIFLRE